MKKVLSIALVLSFISILAMPVFSAIQGQNVNDLITSELKQVRRTAISARNSLNVCKAKMQSINSNYGSEIDKADLTKLTSIFNKMVTSASQLDALGIDIDTNFPTIQE